MMTVALFQYQFPSQIPSLTPLIPNLPLHTILSPLHHQRAGLSLNTNRPPPPQTSLLIQNTPSMETVTTVNLRSRRPITKPPKSKPPPKPSKTQHPRNNPHPLTTHTRSNPPHIKHSHKPPITSQTLYQTTHKSTFWQRPTTNILLLLQNSNSIIQLITTTTHRHTHELL